MNPRRRHRSTPTLLAAATLVVAGALAASTPASAGPPSPREVHREIHRHLHHVVDGVHDVLSVLASIPVALDLHVHPEYDLYLDGEVYYAPHGHYHPLYRFPVWADGAVVYRPQVYCGGRIFVAGGYAPYYGPDRYRYPGYRNDRYDRGHPGYRSHGSYQGYRGYPGYRDSRESRHDRGGSSYRSHPGQGRGDASYDRDDRGDHHRGRQAARGNDSRQRHSGERGRDRGQGRR